MRDVLAWAEGHFERRLDEVPRPHLVERWGDASSPDTIRVDVDAPLPSEPPGTQHLARPGSTVPIEAGAPSYLSRMLASRGENLQRRIAVVAPRGAQLSRGWLEAASALVPVYRDQSAREALGQTVPRARIVGDVEASEWAKLIELPLEAVSFAERILEARWLGGLD